MLKIKTRDAASEEASRKVGDLDAAFISFVATNSIRTPWAVVLMFVLLAVIAHQHLASPAALIWFLLASAFSFYRAQQLKKLQPGSEAENTQRMKKIASLSLVNGLLTSSYLLFFIYLTSAEQALATLLLISLCTGAVGTTTGQPKVFWLYSAPMLISLSVSWLVATNNVDVHWIDKTIGLLIFLYGWVLHGLAKATYTSFCESHAIRYHEHELNTQLKVAVTAAEEASQSKTRFLASASHDLRQPLHAISLLIASLTLRPLDARSREIVQFLETANNSLAALFDSLLDISKLDAGLVKPEKELINLATLAAECFFLNQENIEEKGLRAILDVPVGASLYVLSDKVLILRILQNLIDNAIKFTETGSITVCVKLNEMQAHLSVQDTGIGIPQELQSAIFQEYFQVHNEQRDRSKGLGLGLSIVQRLVAITGGHLGLESNASGSRFSITYPVADQGLHQITRARKPEAYPLQAHQFDELKVLIVDDEITVKQSVSALLEEMGCHVVQASSTQEAVIQIQDWTPDVVLADFRLGDGDSGLKTIQALRQSLPYLPAFMISGDTAPSRLKEAAEAGFQILHKPLRLEQLRQVLSEAMTQKKIGEAITS
jgi:signal transduction histidine kinase/ActR/RegA family two-component response regulator